MSSKPTKSAEYSWKQFSAWLFRRVLLYGGIVFAFYMWPVIKFEYSLRNASSAFVQIIRTPTELKADLRHATSDRLCKGYRISQQKMAELLPLLRKHTKALRYPIYAQFPSIRVHLQDKHGHGYLTLLIYAGYAINASSYQPLKSFAIAGDEISANDWPIDDHSCDVLMRSLR